MVSLYQLIQDGKDGVSGLSTGIASVDKLLFRQSILGVFDFQTVPNCNGGNVVLMSIMTSHLMLGGDKKVIVVNCGSSRLPIEEGFKHGDFDRLWEPRIRRYTCDSYVKLVMVIESFINHHDDYKSTVVIMAGFHELLEYYKLQLSAAYEETLLKIHANDNSTLINNRDMIQTEGTIPKLTTIPHGSDLVRESPLLKYESHLLHLFNLLSQFSHVTGNLSVFLAGTLDTKYEYYTPRDIDIGTDANYSSSQILPSSRDSSRESSMPSRRGRVVFTAANKPHYKSNVKHITSSINKRVIFYHDWYHKSPNFRNNESTEVIAKQKLKQVFCCRVESEGREDVVFFDIVGKEIFDLTGGGETGEREEIGETGETSEREEPSEREDETNTTTNTTITNTNTNFPLPSSPTFTNSQVRHFFPDKSSDFDLIIEDSQEHLIGTPLGKE